MARHAMDECIIINFYGQGWSSRYNYIRNIAYTFKNASSVFNGISMSHISIWVDAIRYHPGIIQLLERVRPAWNEGSVKFKVFEGGLTIDSKGARSVL